MTDQLTPEEIERLSGEAFTAAPWSIDPDPRCPGSAQIVREAHDRLTTTVAFMSTGRHNPREEDDADAALIVYLRNHAAEIASRLREGERLAELLQRAVDDQREVETMQGMVEWYDEAVEALARRSP